MRYDFETLPNKKGHGSSKWVQMYDLNKNIADNVIPLSVADMELKAPPEIIEGLKDYLDEASLGYTKAYPEYTESVKNWMKNRHNFKIEEDWIVVTPGVVSAFTAAIRALTEEGDGVIITRPVYHPMGVAIENSNLAEVNVPLLNNDETYTIDYEGLEKACSDPKNKVLLFCSPHNPTGRVWTREELEKVGEICVKHDVKIVSDEIWNDLIMPGYKHTILASISDEIRDITITCTAASKTFNIAGLYTSNIIIPNEEMRNKFKRQIELMGCTCISALGYKGTEIAYTKCEKWLEQLIGLLDENRKVCIEFFEDRGFTVTRPEGTYILWINFETLGMNVEELEEFMHNDAQFFANQGYIFGEEGELYQRINLAAPTEVLKAQLGNLDRALGERK